MKVIALRNRKRYEGKRLYEIKKGDVYNSTSKVYSVFGASSFMKKPRQVSKQEKYNEIELRLLIELYLDNADPINKSDNRALIIEKYRRSFDTHTDASLEIVINQLKGMDNQYDAVGMSYVTRLLVDLLSAEYSDRFDCGDDTTVVDTFEIDESVPVNEVAPSFSNRLMSAL